MRDRAVTLLLPNRCVTNRTRITRHASNAMLARSAAPLDVDDAPAAMPLMMPRCNTAADFFASAAAANAATRRYASAMLAATMPMLFRHAAHVSLFRDAR